MEIPHQKICIKNTLPLVFHDHDLVPVPTHPLFFLRVSAVVALF